MTSSPDDVTCSMLPDKNSVAPPSEGSRPQCQDDSSTTPPTESGADNGQLPPPPPPAPPINGLAATARPAGTVLLGCEWKNTATPSDDQRLKQLTSSSPLCQTTSQRRDQQTAEETNETTDERNLSTRLERAIVDNNTDNDDGTTCSRMLRILTGNKTRRRTTTGPSVYAEPYRICRPDVDPSHCRVVRIVHISDTHGIHDKLSIPDGDILIHSGDFFTWNEVKNLDTDAAILDGFFAKQRHRHKIFVAGNHEMSFRRHSAESISERLHHVTYLQDSEVKVEGLVVYGSPWTFSRCSPAKAFTVAPHTLRPKYWRNIPDETDILVTHSPPKDILDFDGRLGCPDLRQEILDRIRPMAHLFGHAHHIAQVVKQDGILFSNGTQGDVSFNKSKPVIIDVLVPSSTSDCCGVA